MNQANRFPVESANLSHVNAKKSSSVKNGLSLSSLWSFLLTLVFLRRYTLSNTEKQNYLDAVTCLSRKPSLPEIHSKFPGTRNRYDDFVAVHANQAPYIHWVVSSLTFCCIIKTIRTNTVLPQGFFMAWHRYFVAMYEKALREECDYKGAQPYWNIADDLASGRDVNRWGIFSNTSGFGGNGPYDPNPPGPNQFNLTGSGGGCVPAGPFGVGSTFKVSFDLTGDVSTSHPQCLRRSFAWPNITMGAQKNVDILFSQPNFTMFNERIDPILTTGIPSIHSSVHAGIGGGAGPFSNAFVSPAGKSHKAFATKENL